MVHTLAGMRMCVVRSGSLEVPEPEVERHSRQLHPANTQHNGLSVSVVSVVDEVHNSNGCLHHKIPLYRRPCGSLPSAVRMIS